MTHAVALSQLNHQSHQHVKCSIRQGGLRGFVKLKNMQKSEKNSEVGGWVKPQVRFVFFWEILCFSVLLFCCTCLKKKKMVNGVRLIRVFLEFLDFC